MRPAVLLRRQASQPRKGAPLAVGRPGSSLLTRGYCRQRIAGEDVAQGAEHRHDRGQHPAARGDRDALPSHHALGTERERKREEGGVGVKQVNRELIAKHKAERARDQPERDGVEEQDPDHGRGGVAVAAQVGDQRRRCGTVSNIALKANRNPTSALITENRAVDWLLAAAALANSFSS